MDGRRDDGGQVLPLVVVVMVFFALLALGIGQVGRQAVAHTAAATAADAVALAGAGGGRADAETVAAANGARLRSFERIGASDVRVTVERDGVIAGARARATTIGSAAGGAGGSGARAGLAPAMRAALARAEQVLGQRVPVTSGRRSRAEQQRLWDQRASNPYPVAPPGTSRHESGLAIDVPAAFAERLAAVSGQTGLCRPVPSDPVHFELCGAGFPLGGPG